MIPDDRLEELLHRLADQDPVAPPGFEVVQARLVRARRQRRMRRRISLAGAVAVAVIAAGVALTIPDSQTRRVRLLPAVPAPSVTPGPASPHPTAGAAAGPQRPGALAVGPNGNVYVADGIGHQILEQLPDGRFAALAGTGQPGFSGDGGPATRAAIDGPAGMAFGPDGTLYFADSLNNRIRKVAPDGTISTVAGNGSAGWVASGTPALQASLGNPNDVAIGPGGALYLAAGGSNEVLRLAPDGRLGLVLGNQTYGGSYGIGGRTATASPDGPAGLAFDAAGNLYLFGSADKSLLVVTPTGTVTEPVAQTFYPRGDGGLRRAPDGSVIAMTGESIVRLSPRGMTTIVDFTAHPVSGISNFLPNGIAVGPAGEIYADTFQGNGFASTSALVKVDPSGHHTVLWVPAPAAAGPVG